MPPPIITHNSFIQTILIISHHSSNSLLLQTPHWTFPRRRKTPVAPAAGSTERPGRRILTVVCGWDLSSSAFSCSHASEGSDIASITALNCVLGNVYWFRGSEVCCDVPQNAAELINSMSSLERPNRLIGKKIISKKWLKFLVKISELIIWMSSLKKPNRLIGKKNYFKKWLKFLVQISELIISLSFLEIPNR